MMQEVSIMVAYDAHVVDRPGEEDTLARLVAHSRPLRALRPVVGLFSHHFVYFCLLLAFWLYLFFFPSFIIFFPSLGVMSVFLFNSVPNFSDSPLSFAVFR